jgi:cytoskeletal protein CcmA (bactofilin family)
MWKKPNLPEPRSAPAPAAPAASAPTAPTPAPRVEAKTAERTVIGETMRIKGSMVSREDLLLNGELEGQLDMQNRLTIGPKAKVSANLKAREADISGSVKGNIEAAERIVLRQGANLVGDVRTAGIVIEDGAYFKGGIDIARGENR